MKYTLNYDFQTICPYLSPSLVTPEAAMQLQTLMQMLPKFSYSGLECRLGNGQSQVDLQVCFPPSIPAISAECLVHPVWQQVMEVLTSWIHPHSITNHLVRDIWWEFDALNLANAIPLPSLFFTLYRQPEGRSQPRFDQIMLLLRTLNISPTAALEGNLQRCCAALPVGVDISHVGVMLARRPRTVRLNLRGFSPSSFIEYWKTLQGVLPTWDFASGLSANVDALVFSIDVGNCLLPTIGIEYFFAKQPLTEPRWGLFLSELVNNKLCTAAKRDALLAWPGVMQHPSPGDKFETFSGDGYFLGKRSKRIRWRSLNHLKLVVDSKGCATAKAYLAFGDRWIDRRS